MERSSYIHQNLRNIQKGRKQWLIYITYPLKEIKRGEYQTLEINWEKFNISPDTVVVVVVINSSARRSGSSGRCCSSA